MSDADKKFWGESRRFWFWLSVITGTAVTLCCVAGWLDDGWEGVAGSLGLLALVTLPFVIGALDNQSELARPWPKGEEPWLQGEQKEGEQKETP